MSGQADPCEAPVQLDAVVRPHEALPHQVSEARDPTDLLVAVPGEDESPTQFDSKLMYSLERVDHGGDFPLVVSDPPPPDVATAHIVLAPTVWVVLRHLPRERVDRPALLLDGGCVDVGADVELGSPGPPLVFGHDVAPRPLKTHDLGSGELKVFLGRVVDADLAAELGELLSEKVADHVVVEARRNLGVYAHEPLEEADHLVPMLLDIGENPLFKFGHVNQS